MTKLQLSILMLWCASCSMEDELRRAEPNKIAEVETSDGQSVEFLALRSGGAAFAVRGPAGAAPIDFDALMSQHGGPAGAYRALSGREAPAALYEAANHPSRVGDESRLVLPPPGATQELATSEVAASRAAVETFPSDLSATQWKNLHCPLNWLLYFDGCKVKTNVAEVTTDYRDTKYYAVALQANGGADAFLRINRWNGSNWEVVLYEKVPAGHSYGGVFYDNGAYYRTEAWSRSGTQGKIHFYEKYRLSIAVPTFIENKPSNVSYEFSNDISGVTHDENNWYLTRTHWSFAATSPSGGSIAKVPFERYLGNEPQITRSMPASWKYQDPVNCLPCDNPGEQCCETHRRYTHFGDLVRRGQYLFVGMDGPAGAAIGVFDTNLNPKGYAPLSHNNKAPFVAYNPRSGYLYVPGSAGNTLEKYVITDTSILAGAPEAVWNSTQMLSQVYSNFQGGKFSANGNLWILTGWDGKNREFWGIDGVSGLAQVKGGLTPGAADEAEGVDIIDLDTETRPGLSGQLHLQMLQNNDFTDDDWWFMHWRAPMNRL